GVMFYALVILSFACNYALEIGTDNKFSIAGEPTDSFKSNYEALYFAVVTMTTIGFGDITPLGDRSRFMVLAQGFLAVLFLPMLASQFFDAVRRKKS
ncbi:MAG: potassium channel family protein, partial [Pseudomonadota bacterium]